MERIMKIIKRDGRTVEFDVDKIAQAIFKAAQVLGGKDHEMSEYLAKQVELYLLEVCHNSYPTVEQVQDAVEKILIARVAVDYIRCRQKRGKLNTAFFVFLYKSYRNAAFFKTLCKIIADFSAAADKYVFGFFRRHTETLQKH